MGGVWCGGIEGVPRPAHVVRAATSFGPENSIGPNFVEMSGCGDEKMHFSRITRRNQPEESSQFHRE